ncbi:MAG: tetratricopeptide repeat protein [bacterium]
MVTKPVKILAITSCPLVDRNKKPLRLMSVTRARRLLRNSLKASQIPARVRFVAQALPFLLERENQFDILYYFGAGKDSGAVYLEDEAGKADIVYFSRFAEFLGLAETAKLIIVAGQGSEWVAARIHNRDIPVVAITGEEINERSAGLFNQSFLRALTGGKTLHESFTQGVETVGRDSEIGDPAGKNDLLSGRFLLFASQKRRWERLFPEGEGEYREELDRGGCCHLPHLTGHFVGRQREIQELLESIQKHKITVLSGPAGSGKTELVKAAGWYIQERGDFDEGIFWASSRQDEVRYHFKGLKSLFDSILLARTGEPAEHLSFEKKHEETRKILDSGGTLLVLNNLEVIDKDGDFLRFLTELPPSSRLLIASTHDLPGRLANNIRVGPLTVDACRELFLKVWERNGLYQEYPQEPSRLSRCAERCHQLLSGDTRALELTAGRIISQGAEKVWEELNELNQDEEVKKDLFMQEVGVRTAAEKEASLKKLEEKLEEEKEMAIREVAEKAAGRLEEVREEISEKAAGRLKKAKKAIAGIAADKLESDKKSISEQTAEKLAKVIQEIEEQALEKLAASREEIEAGNASKLAIADKLLVKKKIAQKKARAIKEAKHEAAREEAGKIEALDKEFEEQVVEKLKSTEKDLNKLEENEQKEAARKLAELELTEITAVEEEFADKLEEEIWKAGRWEAVKKEAALKKFEDTARGDTEPEPTILDLSFNDLTEPQEKLFLGLSLFFGPADIEAIREVLVIDDPVDSLEVLLRRSLIVKEGDYYFLLPEVREFARNKLEELEINLEAVHKNAVLFYKLFITGHPLPSHDEKSRLSPQIGETPLRSFPGKKQTGLNVLYLFDHLQVLAERYHDRSAWEETVRFALCLEESLFEANYWNLAQEVLEKGLAAAGKLPDPEGEARLLNRQGKRHLTKGRTEQAGHDFQKALAAYTDSGDKQGQGELLSGLGDLALSDEEGASKALEIYRKTLLINEELDNPAGQAENWEKIGTACLALGRLDEALNAFLTSQKLLESMGDLPGQARSWQLIGLAYETVKDWKSAIHYLEKAFTAWSQADLPEERESASEDLKRLYRSLEESPQEEP